MAVLAIIILAILVALLVVVARIFQIDRVVTVFKILLGFAQVMGVTAQVMKIVIYSLVIASILFYIFDVDFIPMCFYVAGL